MAALNAERNFPRKNTRQSPSCVVSDTISCPPSKFRKPTGECNNVRHARWGNRGAAFLRLLPPDYADGKLLIRPEQGIKLSF